LVTKTVNIYLLGEIFWIFREDVPFIVGSIQFLIAALFYGASSLVNICSEKPFVKLSWRMYKRMIVYSIYLVIIGLAFGELTVKEKISYILRHRKQLCP